MARLFFALWPDDHTRKQLFDVALQFKDDDLRLVKKSNLHMTLEFLGEVSAEDQQGLIEKAGKIAEESFDIELTRVGFWKKPKILFIGTTRVPVALQQLVKSIRKLVKQQGLKPDTREYKPHVTVARKAKKVVVPLETINIKWTADRFALVVSESTTNGIVYRVLESWPLEP